MSSGSILPIHRPVVRDGSHYKAINCNGRRAEMTVTPPGELFFPEGSFNTLAYFPRTRFAKCFGVCGTFLKNSTPETLSLDFITSFFGKTARFRKVRWP